jgi:peptidoglycan hydrolase CwlO-like protein
MVERSLTALLETYHDKLDQHTTELKDIEAKLTSLEASVSKLEDKVFDEDESSTLPALVHLRSWLNEIRELM